MYGCRVFGLTLGLGGDFLRGEGWRTRRAEDNAGEQYLLGFQGNIYRLEAK